MSATLAASAPARADRAIVFACDGRYLPYALFAADRLARLPTSRTQLVQGQGQGDRLLRRPAYPRGSRNCG